MSKRYDVKIRLTGWNHGSDEVEKTEFDYSLCVADFELSDIQDAMDHYGEGSSVDDGMRYLAYEFAARELSGEYTTNASLAYSDMSWEFDGVEADIDVEVVE